MFYLNVLLIAVIFVIAIDIAKFWDEFSSYISYIITKGKSKKSWDIKPMSCSFCMTFWTSVVYMIIANQFSILNTAYIIFISYMTGIIYEILVKFYDLIIKILRKI